MHTSQILLATGLSMAAQAAAQASSSVEPIGTACASALQDNAEAIEAFPPVPTDNDAFLEFLINQDGGWGVDDPCFIPAVTGDPELVSSYSSWVSEATAWVSEFNSELDELLTVCAADEPEVLQNIGLESACKTWNLGTAPASSGPVPSQTPAPNNGTTTTRPAAEETGGDDESPSSTSGGEAAASSEPTGAAAALARQTGLAVAAAAVAGVAFGLY